MQFHYFQLILFFPDKICPESDPRTSCLNWQRGLDLQNEKIYWNLILTCELLLLFSAIWWFYTRSIRAVHFCFITLANTLPHLCVLKRIRKERTRLTLIALAWTISLADSSHTNQRQILPRNPRNRSQIPRLESWSSCRRIKKKHPVIKQQRPRKKRLVLTNSNECSSI